jgi:hypothetical protein
MLFVRNGILRASPDFDEGIIERSWRDLAYPFDVPSSANILHVTADRFWLVEPGDSLGGNAHGKIRVRVVDVQEP